MSLIASISGVQPYETLRPLAESVSHTAPTENNQTVAFALELVGMSVRDTEILSCNLALHVYNNP